MEAYHLWFILYIQQMHAAKNRYMYIYFIYIVVQQNTCQCNNNTLYYAFSLANASNPLFSGNHRAFVITSDNIQIHNHF